ncbi:Anaerobic dimethyl sulfoxide reductase chain C [Paramagnetospirillum magnetotacticum MS-1]|uniref:Anaerobic dimethyl sulfoxide reductase chain C n=1 Tax=Paramagnetospirillum magnetotacticum MS-1 TaxID=272627 RepID=A0A0C2UCS7_PARME|nr:DmsC/YnfH family molybdoenzyme membrane anchor subunit [Paramagnetospirillum magnetotacticum]KIL99317.1 Anaerobic dimethyl sulfoxide reductase chain C [Paramagnetospirillum magnetotacticum MS-1]
MKPAFSVIFLTTLIGAGQGLLIALTLGQLYAGGASGGFFALGGAIALVLLCLGLVASVFHLANPQRGWRAATRWRTSWLSREVILIPVVCGLAFLYAVIHAFGWAPVVIRLGNGAVMDLPLVLGLLTTVASLALFVCTGMIYACVKFIRQWASGWTVINYLLMGLASGFTLATAYAQVQDSPLTGFMSGSAVLLTPLALAARGFQMWLNATARPRSSLKSAIGVHHAQIRQVTQGFMGSSFNTIEFAAPGGAETVKGLSVFFLAVAFIAPAALLLAGLPVLAFVCQYVGLLAERWVFFAAGSHVQSLYYQAKG